MPRAFFYCFENVCGGKLFEMSARGTSGDVLAILCVI